MKEINGLEGGIFEEGIGTDICWRKSGALVDDISCKLRFFQ